MWRLTAKNLWAHKVRLTLTERDRVSHGVRYKVALWIKAQIGQALHDLLQARSQLLEHVGVFGIAGQIIDFVRIGLDVE